MNDKQYAAQKKRIQSIVDRWMGPLGLKWWEIIFTYSREGAIDVSPVAGATTLAKTWVTWEYKQARITFDMPEVAELSDETLERAVVHEFMHIFLNEMRDFDQGMGHEERVATDLANAFLWLRDHLESPS